MIETVFGGAFIFQKYIRETFILSKYNATIIEEQHSKNASLNGIRENAPPEIFSNHYLYECKD